jgi:predicted Ser/Thr protein kinase
MTAPSDPTVLERALGGSYRVLRLLGRGGMGAVYLARDETLDRLVAVKVISGQGPGDAAGRERFRREARAAARLHHPGVVPLHAFGEVEGTMYFVMGYVRGESLGQRLRREGKLPQEEGLRVLAEVADALDHAHRQGVVHRDVKPDNVLLDDESGRALLTDFGVAKIESGGATLTAAGSIVGTPHFMSPEQITGSAVDGRSDLYALGVVGYAVLAGRLPFEGASAQEIVLQHLAKAAPPLTALEPSVPAEVSAALARCLAKDPAARWADAAQLREVLAPGTREETALPQALASVEGSGAWLAPWAAALLYGFWLEQLWALSPAAAAPLRFILALLALLPARDLGRVMVARRRGFAWSAIARATLRQPRWWPCWYPRSLRGPGDVWDRLPRATRRLRILLEVIVAMGILEVLLVFALLGVPAETLHDEARARMVAGLTTLALAALPVGLALGLAWYNLGKSWALRRGLDAMDGYRLVLEPTSGSRFWKRPQIARLLARGDVRPAPRSPADHMAAIEQAARALPEDAARDALALARQLAARLAALDREVVRLGRDADPRESARLEERLAALGTESAGEPEERRRMRELIRQQRALVDSVSARLTAAEALRAGMLRLLAELWEGLSRLAERPAGREHAAREVRDLCAALSRQAPPDAAGSEGTLDEMPTRERPLP